MLFYLLIIIAASPQIIFAKAQPRASQIFERLLALENNSLNPLPHRTVQTPLSNNNALQDPVVQFTNNIFQLIASVINPENLNLSIMQRQFFVDALSKAKSTNPAFGPGFSLSFLRRTTFPILRSTFKKETLESCANALSEFLGGQGIIEPSTPQELKNPDLLNQILNQTQQQTLAENLLNEFILMHNYAAAWSLFAQKAQNTEPQQPASVEQLNNELKMLELAIEKEKKLLAQDEIKTLRAKTQKLTKLEELIVEEKMLEFEKQKNKFEHQKKLDDLDVNRKQQEHHLALSQAQLKLSHEEKLLQLEQKKAELEIQRNEFLVFEKTVQKFSECLTLFSNLKKH